MKVSELIRQLIAALAVVLVGLACLHFWGLYGWLLFGGLYLLAYVFTMDVLDVIERKIENMTITMHTKHTDARPRDLIP